MMRLPTFLLAGVLISACRGKSPHPGKSIGVERHAEARDLYQFAESHRQKHDLPALGVGIVRDGKIIGLGMAGERKAGSGDWATLGDLFDVGSCAKAVTATVAAMLVEKGVVRWDMTIQEIFPEMRQSIRAAYSDVTLEMLLRHRSGLERWMSSNQRWSKWHRDHTNMSATEKRRLFAATVLKSPPRHAPGADFYYSNDGYLLAASMIEKVSGRAWESSVRELLLQPLGLGTMRFGVPTPDVTTPVVWGHENGLFGRARAIKPDPGEYGDPPFGSPGGFLHCTVVDLLRFVDFHIQGAYGNGQLLSRDSFTRLHTPLEKQQYALGWEVEVRRDRQGALLERSIYHGGFSGRFRANMWFSPESQTGTVIVYNDGGDDAADAYATVFYALLEEFGLWKKQPR